MRCELCCPPSTNANRKLYESGIQINNVRRQDDSQPSHHARDRFGGDIASALGVLERGLSRMLDGDIPINEARGAHSRLREVTFLSPRQRSAKAPAISAKPHHR